MTDSQLLDLLDNLNERPRLTVGNGRYVHVGRAILEFTRVGKGERWAFSPAHGIYPIDTLPSWWPREVRLWAYRAARLDFTAHARAMAARTV